MSEEEKVLLEDVKKHLNAEWFEKAIVEDLVNITEKQQKEYDLLLNGYNKLVQEHIKAEKVIDNMAEALQKECRKGLLKETPFYCQKNCYLGFGFWIKPMKKCSNCVKEYFYKEIENE